MKHPVWLMDDVIGTEGDHSPEAQRKAMAFVAGIETPYCGSTIDPLQLVDGSDLPLVVSIVKSRT